MPARMDKGLVWKKTKGGYGLALNGASGALFSDR